MTMLILQILLLMLAAYFIGAAIACGLRKMVAPQRRAASVDVMTPARPVEPLAQATRQQVPRATQAETVSRFEKALGTDAPRPAPQPAVAPPPPRVAPPAPVAAPVVAAAAPVVAKAVHTHAPVEAPHPAPPSELVVPPPPRITLTAPPTPAVEPVKPVASAALAAGVATASAAAAAAALAARSAPVPAVAKPATPAVVTPGVARPAAPVVAQPVAPSVMKTVTTAAPAVAAADNLMRIRGIDQAIATRLNSLGVTRYSQIAGWMRPEVTKINQGLGFKNRVESENWIEQAQILAGGGETLFSRRFAGGQPNIVQPVSAQPAPANPVAPMVTANLVRTNPAPTVGGMQGLAAAAAAATVAAPRSQSVTAPVSTPVPPPAPSPARVVERAAFETAPRAPAQQVPTSAPSVFAPAVTATPVKPPVAHVTPAVVTPAGVNYPPMPNAQPVRPAAMAPTRDALQRINGVNGEIEKLLNVQGVTRYGQIAAWGNPEVERFDRLLGSPGRVRRESWIEQAQMLSKGGDTSGARQPVVATPAPVAPVPVASAPVSPVAAASPAPAMSAVAAATAAAAASAAAAAIARPARLQDAIQAQQTAPVAAPASAEGVVPRGDLANLRSVRSEAFQPISGGTRGAALDDLKRIRGVGVLIEKRLNALGVTGYEQIANWTQDDIARYSQQLDFKGRIERENWVEQARILASGGFTEFSRRVDRGEVETSRLKT